MRFALAPILATVVVAGPLMAQAPPQAALYVGGGIEAVGVGAPYERAYGLSLQLGYGWQFRQLGVRVNTTYFQRSRVVSGTPNRSRAVGATLELSYDLTSSRLRPYIIGGWGVYRLWGTLPSQGGTRAVRHVSPAMLGGVGLRYRVADRELFLEGRLHGFTNGQDWGSAFMPVTLGVRF